MTNLLAVVFAVVALSWAPVLAGKGKHQEVWDSLGRSKDQGLYLPGSGINLTLNVSLISFSDYDWKSSSIAISYWAVMMWKDPTIQWNATKQGLSSLRVPADMLWTPDIVPYMSKEHDIDFKTYAVVYSDGSVIYVPAYTTRIACKNMKSKNKKVVKKQCPLKLGSWVFDGNTLNITSSDIDTSNLNTDPLKESGMSIVTIKKKFATKSYPCCPEPYQSYTLTSIIKGSSKREYEEGEMGDSVEEVEEVAEGEEEVEVEEVGEGDGEEEMEDDEDRD